MIKAKGYAAQRINDRLALWSFERGDVGSHDVPVEIMHSVVCHSDLHTIKIIGVKGYLLL
ncbi:hypothetical protein [uncultured Dysgonomonas sp.]|uniref:Uncharacterized protein n=1 Tax=uncultured Dysgonomonas sp. TaxID=206096 RepID=A0A212IUD3_9BACT|nr:hypothetical protein [uncultured Dysgonomonas sp.]SBV90515.1 hypothetical protein KL86DYS1_10092 [uncultured Dysgonomonas sp.]